MPDDLIARLLERLDALLSQMDSLRRDQDSLRRELAASHATSRATLGHVISYADRIGALERRMDRIERGELSSITTGTVVQWPPRMDADVDDDADTAEHPLPVPDEDMRW